jgi:hypothetical protein
MKSRFASVFLVAATVLAGAAHAASIDKKEHVTLDRAALVGGVVLPAGNYRVELAADPDTARFVVGKRTVAETTCKIRLAHVYYRGDAVHYLTGDGGHDRLVKLVFASSRLAVEFPTEVEGGTGAPIASAADRR